MQVIGHLLAKISMLERGRFAVMIAVIMSSLLLTGCLPKDVKLPLGLSSEGNKTYDDFTGVGAVQTLSASKLRVSWAPSQSPEVVAYNVYDASYMFSPQLLKTVPAGSSETTLTKLDAQRVYLIRVRAADAEGVEDSNTKTIAGIPYGGVISADVTGSDRAKIKFNAAEDADSIRIYCKAASEASYSEKAEISDGSLSEYLVTGFTPAIQYTCRVAIEIDNNIDNNTETVTFTPMGQAAKVQFVAAPNGGTAGVAFSTQPVVQIQDVAGNVVSAGPDASALITLTIATDSPTQGSLRGSVSVQAVGGVATFSGLNIQEAGQKILTATKADTSSQTYGTEAFTTNTEAFTIVPGTVSAQTSSITISPEVPPEPALVANGTSAYAVTITLRDQYSNVISGIRPAFASSVAGDLIVQPTQATNASGQSTGSLSATVADGTIPRMISISSPSGLSTVKTAAPFVAGPATKLAFTMQPTNSPAGLQGLNEMRVTVQDAQGNAVTTGDAASQEITLSIAANINGATLTGTNTVVSVNGVAKFTGLGIDKIGTGYRLMASSGSLTPAQSNNFNVTAGIPRKIVIAGANYVISGQCSAAITFQLQDLGNNPANAIANTPIAISGLNGAALYSSSACSGSAVSSTVTFTAGTNTRTYYLKSQKAQSITIQAADTSNVLVAGSSSVKIAPSKISLIAQAPAPAAPGTPLSVVAGQCSSAIKITPSGEDESAAPIFIDTPVTITGLIGSEAKLYSDPSCTIELDPLNLVLKPTVAPNLTINLYTKDDRSEELALSIVDTTSSMATITALQTVLFTPSDLDFRGPSAVVAGRCSSVFTLELKDRKGNIALTPADLQLQINGISTSSPARIYTSASCTGSGSRTTISISSGSSVSQLYLKSNAAETLQLFISDPQNKINSSPTLNVGISPSALKLTGVTPAQSSSGLCVGPFKVETLDGVNAVTAAINPITVNLTGNGSGGSFHSDSGCETTITSLLFNTGDSEKQFYYLGSYPAASLTFMAADAAAVLTSATTAHKVTAAPGWLGVLAKQTDANGDLLWFRPGVKPVAARADGVYGAQALAFSADMKFLYVADHAYNRVVKYDYENKKYIGWIGRLNFDQTRFGLSGSNIVKPSSASCVDTRHWEGLPGWCVGGVPGQDGNIASSGGAVCNPRSLYEDGEYLYVVNDCGRPNVTRHDAVTGAFRGWIGTVETTPSAPAPGGPGTCTSTTNNKRTPGWCYGGLPRYPANWYTPVSQGMYAPRAITGDDTYLYVAAWGAVHRYSKADGSHQGWIGRASVPTSGGVPPTDGATGCESLKDNERTPGWCNGGTPRGDLDARQGAIYQPTSILIVNGVLHVVDPNWGGVVGRYNVDTGAWIGTLPDLGYNWVGPNQMTFDGIDFFVADSTRIIRVDQFGTVQGWLGKVSNSGSMSPEKCKSLATNANTPGWCLGGSSKAGLEDEAIHQATAIVYDNKGNLIVGQGTRYPGLKMFDALTGVYKGTLGFDNAGPKRWSNDASAFAQLYGFDDLSYYQPGGVYAHGDFLYVTERVSGRIKKIKKTTGETVGWIGGITTSPTGGATGCLGANPMAPAPTWCLGSYFQPNYMWNNIIPQTSPGLIYDAGGITGDGTYLYVTDWAWHRILRFDLSSGEFKGWIGRISTSPTGGDKLACNGATGFTPGWCTGGTPQSGTGNGHLTLPGGILAANGNLYVIDAGNGRVSRYTASDGAFTGWIGAVETATTTCSTTSLGGYTISNGGWCMGGTARRYSDGNYGGAFSFEWGWQPGGITTDGSHLYITNPRYRRIDKYTLNGVPVASVSTRTDMYINIWKAPGIALTQNEFTAWCSRPDGQIWTDGTYLYGTVTEACNGAGWGSPATFKMDLATGNMIGWRGGINPGSNTGPTGGEPGCLGASNVTPAWCQGGQPANGYLLGQFSGRGHVFGDSEFIYIANEDSHRVMRLPK